MTDDSLLYLLRAPAFVESTVRAALRETLSLRQQFGAEVDIRAFTRLALVRSQRCREGASADALTRYELEAAVVRAAAFFAASPLGRRLRNIPLARIAVAPRGFDVAVADRNGHLHYVRLETYAGTQARLEAVARAVRAMDGRHADGRVALHFFSLRDGTLRSYPAAPANSRIVKGYAAPAAA